MTKFLNRFWAKVDRRTEDECWPWAAYVSRDGYGHFWRDGQAVSAHRIAYELAYGPVPYGKQIDHLCRNRDCCNHSHLEAVTQGENIRRGEVGINMRSKTHCPQGHPYSGLNLYVTPDGRRDCKTCRRDRMRVRSQAMAVAGKNPAGAFARLSAPIDAEVREVT